MSAQLRCDIVMVSDFRFPGGTSASLAEEVRAQAAGGYTTALVQVDGPLVAKARGFHRRIRYCVEEGLATLVPPGEKVSARLALFRHPAVFADLPQTAPAISPGRSVVVANQAARDATSDQVYYDVERVHASITSITGHDPVWAPIGPKARASLETLPDGAAVLDADWHNIIAPEEWRVDRSAFVADRPVIGRHSRPHPSKWPSTRDDLLAAYPADGEFIVRVMGGAQVPRQVLGRLPGSWQVEDFDARPVSEFLRDLDFFVYYHHPAWVEAFGRSVLEALASGAVAVLPAHFAELFGDAAAYGEPADVRGIVRDLYRDKSAYDAQSARGTALVEDRFGPATHVARVAELIGPPAAPRPRTIPASVVRPPRVLLVSSNGAGMGHLTRLAAMARRASEAVSPMFFSLSEAVPVVAGDQFPYEYCPSRATLRMDTATWNAMFARRLHETLERYRPRAVVFDGTWPYRGLLEARQAFPGVAFVWSRRAMWKQEIPPDQLERATAFDLVIEPGELAASYDRGVTAQAQALRVDPMVLLDPDDLLDPGEAKHALGLDPERPAVLVTLGAGNINDLDRDLGVISAVLAQDEGRQICVTRPPIAGRAQELAARIAVLSVYPLSRYLRAFDFVISAAGYNSFHEQIAFGAPSVFVPNLATRTDDQLARARYAAQLELGLCVETVTHEAVARAVAAVEDEGTREKMRDACVRHWPGNGAGAAMAAVEGLIRARLSRDNR